MEVESYVEVSRYVNISCQLASCALWTYMIVIGSSYSDKCEFDVPLYLILDGEIMLGMTILLMIATCCTYSPGGESTWAFFPAHLLPYLYGLVGLVCLGLTTWGSLLVFGNYGSFTSNEGSRSATFCHEAPYMLAMGIIYFRFFGIPAFMALSWAMIHDLGQTRYKHFLEAFFHVYAFKRPRNTDKVSIS